MDVSGNGNKAATAAEKGQRPAENSAQKSDSASLKSLCANNL